MLNCGKNDITWNNERGFSHVSRYIFTLETATLWMVAKKKDNSGGIFLPSSGGMRNEKLAQIISADKKFYFVAPKKPHNQS